MRVGFADLHAHQFARLGFGGNGRAIWGQESGDLDKAMPSCEPVHGPFGLGDKASLPFALFWAHGTLGFPKFDGWPAWSSFSHQSMYESWLKRAWQGGLRLMVMDAVNNRFLCTNIEADKTRCADMDNVDRQLQAALDFETNAGKGWYRIVRSSAEARKALDDGVLAVVLGIEVDRLFSCGEKGSKVNCTPEYVRDQLAAYYAKGVRKLIPIHLSDNAFGGEAVYNLISDGEKRDCSSEGYGYIQLGQIWPTCSAHGLRPLGKTFIEMAMKAHIMVDVTHMSRRSVDDTLAIAERLHAPVVASHVWMLELALRDFQNEYAIRPEQLERIRRLGGLVGPLLNQGDLEDVRTWHALNQVSIEHRCGGTSQTWVQAYLYAAKKMQGRGVAFGSDFNGFAGLPGPRFGDSHCPGGRSTNDLPNDLVQYPFALPGLPASMDRDRTADRVFDINFDGIAHVGMLPDLIEDLRRQGVPEKELRPLFESAKAYVDAWAALEAITP